MAGNAIFKGVGVALITLFKDDRALDAAATARFAGRLVDLGVKAIVVAGSTGEAAALDPDEHTKLVGAVREAVPQQSGVPVIAGVGAPSARQAVRLTVAARDLGADVVIALSPPRTGDPRPYYEQVAEAAGATPVMAYHFPAVSPPGVPVEVLGDLPVAALKDSSGEVARLLATLDSWDRPVYPGSSSMITFAGAIGCPGVVIGLANVEPELCAAAFGGDASAQLKLAKLRASELRFPHGLKALVAARFGCSTTARIG